MSSLQGLCAWPSVGLSWVMVPWEVCLVHFCVCSWCHESPYAELGSWPASTCRLGAPRTHLPLGSWERGIGPIASNGLGGFETGGSCHHQEGDRTSGYA